MFGSEQVKLLSGKLCEQMVWPETVQSGHFKREICDSHFTEYNYQGLPAKKCFINRV